MHPLLWIDRDLGSVASCPFWMPQEAWQCGQRQVRLLISEQEPHDPICWSFHSGAFSIAPKRAVWLEACLQRNHNKNLEQCASDLLLAWFAETQTDDPESFFRSVSALPKLPESLQMLQISQGMILWEQQHRAFGEEPDLLLRRLPGNRVFAAGHPALGKLVPHWLDTIMTWEDLLNLSNFCPYDDCFLPEGVAFPVLSETDQDTKGHLYHSNRQGRIP